MMNAYIFAAAVGWPLLGIMLLFGGDTEFDLDADVDVDFDMDMDVDMDMDADLDGDFDVSGGAFGDVFSSMLSIRSIIFFAAFFGAAGLLFSIGSDSDTAVFILALAFGVLGAFANGWLTNWLKRSTSTSMLGRRAFEGQAGRVTVPLREGAKGQVSVLIDGQPVKMTAIPFKQNEVFEAGDQVVVVEMDERGTALIARLDELAHGDE